MIMSDDTCLPKTPTQKISLHKTTAGLSCATPSTRSKTSQFVLSIAVVQKPPASCGLGIVVSIPARIFVAWVDFGGLSVYGKDIPAIPLHPRTRKTISRE